MLKRGERSEKNAPTAFAFVRFVISHRQIPILPMLWRRWSEIVSNEIQLPVNPVKQPASHPANQPLSLSLWQFLKDHSFRHCIHSMPHTIQLRFYLILFNVFSRMSHHSRLFQFKFEIYSSRLPICHCLVRRLSDDNEEYKNTPILYVSCLCL